MPLKAKPGTINETLMRAAAHPLRVQAFSVMAERPASSSEIAAMAGEETSTVAYHVRELEKLGLVEHVETKTGGQRRGGAEKFFRAIQRPLITDEEWRNFNVEERANVSIVFVQLVMMDLARAISAMTLDVRDDRHLSRSPLLVDQEGWIELVDLHNECLDRALEVQARSAERMTRQGVEGINVFSTQMLFEAPRVEPPSG